MTEIDTSGISRAMTLIYLVAAARKDATPDQVEQLKAAADRLKVPLAEGGGQMSDVAQRVVDIMGSDWLPADEYLDAIEAMIGAKLPGRAPRPVSPRVGQTSEEW